MLSAADAEAAAINYIDARRGITSFDIAARQKAIVLASAEPSATIAAPIGLSAAGATVVTPRASSRLDPSFARTATDPTPLPSLQSRRQP
jgi:hypothetical protein